MKSLLATICVALSVCALAQSPKTGMTESDRITYDMWTNLIDAVNQRCEITHYGYTNTGVPPLTSTASIYLIPPTNHIATWSISAGLMRGPVTCLTNAATTNATCYTNYSIGAVPVRFTNMIGSLTEQRFMDWSSTMSGWVLDTPALFPITVTNLALTAENVYDLDSRIRGLIPYYLDMVQIEAAGGLDAWFAKEPYPKSPPFLTISNAWMYAGLPSKRFENGSQQYYFSLAPSVEVFQVQLGSLALIEIGRTIVTNRIVSGGVTNVETETIKRLEWRQEPHTFNELFGHPLIQADHYTNARPSMSLTLPGTNLWTNGPVSVAVSSRISHASATVVRSSEVITVGPDTPASAMLPHYMVIQMSSTNTVSEVFHDPPRKNEVRHSQEGARISLAFSNIYHRLHSPDRPGVTRMGRADSLSPVAARSLLLERWSIITQLTHTALSFTPRYNDSSPLAQPVPVLAAPPPVITNGYIDASRGRSFADQRNYDLVAGRDPSSYRTSGRSYLEVVSERYDNIFPWIPPEVIDYTNRVDEFAETPFYGFLAQLDLNTNYSYVGSFGSSDIAFSWVAEPARSVQSTRAYDRRGRVIFDPFTGRIGHYEVSRDEEEKLFNEPIVRINWPLTINVSLTNLSTELKGRSLLYALLTNDLPGADFWVLEVNRYKDGTDCSDSLSEKLIEHRLLEPNPAEMLPSGYFHNYGQESLAELGMVEFGGVDFNLGISPDTTWLGYQQVPTPPCSFDYDTGGIVTNNYGIVSSGSGSEIKTRTYHFNYPKYRDINRRLESVWVIFDWQFGGSYPYH